MGHLDESLTRLARKTGAGIKKHWKLLTAAAAIVTLAVLIVQVQSRLSETRAEQISRRLYELTLPPRPGEETEPEIDDIRRLVADVEGTHAEKAVIKMAGGYLARQAESFAEKAREEEDAKPNDADATEASDAKATAAALFDAAVEIVERGQARFPSDTRDVGPWAESLLQRIRTVRDRSWMPAPRSFGLRPPPPPAEDEAQPPDEESREAGPAAGAAAAESEPQETEETEEIEANETAHEPEETGAVEVPPEERGSQPPAGGETGAAESGEEPPATATTGASGPPSAGK
ncbi:MAG: hypothetical protein JXA90_14950 [Planctomycetes bacterium]|nr:hypothetical protein [Planctomycetota bacterium]